MGLLHMRSYFWTTNLKTSVTYVSFAQILAKPQTLVHMHQVAVSLHIAVRAACSS